MENNWEKETEFLIELKLQQLRRGSLSRLSADQLKRTLLIGKWENNVPAHLCTIASDIRALTAEDIVKYLTKESWVTKYSLADLTDSIEGDENEKE
ncbi:MAG: hypothetical protein IJI05_01440 [Erysipelotrichaceae bacterium]|nr:hypothetical protein [Erysipelotrichaceae bacterium]